MTRHVKASEFKAKRLALMDEVARTNHSVVITKKGRTRTTPAQEAQPIWYY